MYSFDSKHQNVKLLAFFGHNYQHSIVGHFLFYKTVEIIPGETFVRSFLSYTMSKDKIVTLLRYTHDNAFFCFDHSKSLLVVADNEDKMLKGYKFTFKIPDEKAESTLFYKFKY